MKTITARTPTGATWRVRVAWQPRWSPLVRRIGAWRRERSKGNDRLDGLDGCNPSGCDGDLEAILVGIVLLIVGGLLLWFLIIPLLLLLVDVIVVIALLALAIPARVLFRRPWTVEAASDDGQTERIFSVEVVGWRRALDQRDDIVTKLEQGFPAPIVGTLRSCLSAPPPG